ncbi:MAG: hypothetical protein KDM81_14240, partial [Verrucomicrobiae bacterium]|nr:hypothetical protein [Verrucomicrobiae bacterium]
MSLTCFTERRPARRRLLPPAWRGGLGLAAFLTARDGMGSGAVPEPVPLVWNGESRLWLMNPELETPPRPLPLPAKPGGVTYRDNTVYVTTEEPAGRVLVVDPRSGAVRRVYPVGHTPMAPVLSPDGRDLYLALRFDNAVASLDLETGVLRRAEVVRQPVALALSPDGVRLFVANLLPEVRPALDDENPTIAAEVSVIDTVTWRVLRNIELPNGSHSLRGIAVSPDGAQVAVVHILANYTRPTWTLEGGMMNRNVVSLIDARTWERIATVPLDDPDLGAANP